jgi:hypothetical protein
MRDLSQGFALALAALALAACSTSKPTIQYDGETYDGMVPVTGTGMQQAWVKPDINISHYRQLLLEPAEFEFRATRPGAERAPLDPTVREFPISQQDRARLVDTVTEVFRGALAESRHFTLTDQPGPDVLVVQVSLLDVVSKVPPEVAGRTNVYVTEFGSATLVLELRDAESGEILARAVDRRAAEPFGGNLGSQDLSIANPVTTAMEVRRAAQRWAVIVTQRIDQLYNRGRMPSQAPP